MPHAGICAGGRPQGRSLPQPAGFTGQRCIPSSSVSIPYVRRWAGKKYRRLRPAVRFKRWWTGLIERQPRLFAQWRWIRAY